MVVHWLGPVDYPAISVSQDLVVGGRWSAKLQDAAGSILEQRGEFREIVPLDRLVFTFIWEGDHEDGEPVDTLVSIALSDAPGGRTRMIFRYEFLKSAIGLDGHHHGWTSSFGRLSEWIGSKTMEGTQ